MKKVKKRGKDQQTWPAGLSAPENSVRQYYERNTRLFLLPGGRKSTGSIHRAVWAAGVGNAQTALNFTNQLICTSLLELAQQSPGGTIRVADLGCGVGGSLIYVAERMGDSFWGVGATISQHQARMAQQQAERFGFLDRCAFLEADYLALPLSGGWDAAFSIEAFAHAPHPQKYFSEASRILRNGGRLLLCDDFRSKQVLTGNFWLSAFRRGWRVESILTLSHAEEIAQGCGLRLVEQRDLTPDLRLSQLPAWMAHWLVTIGLGLNDPYWQSVAGGIALQQALKTGVVTYRFLVFEKSA